MQPFKRILGIVTVMLTAFGFQASHGAEPEPVKSELGQVIGVYEEFNQFQIDPTTFSYKKANSLTIRGGAVTANTIYEYVEYLERSKKFSDIKPDIKTKLVKGKRVIEFHILAELKKSPGEVEPAALSLPADTDVTSLCLKTIQRCADKHKVNILRQEPEKDKAGITITCAWEGLPDLFIQFIEALPAQDPSCQIQNFVMAQSRTSKDRWKGNLSVRYGNEFPPPPPPPPPVSRTYPRYKPELTQQVLSALIDHYAKALVDLKLKHIESTSMFGEGNHRVLVVEKQIQAVQTELDSLRTGKVP